MADADFDDVQLTAMGHQHTIAVRQVSPMADVDVGALFAATMPRLMATLGERSAEPTGAPYARYFAFGAEQADIEIGVPVDEALEGLGELVVGGDVGMTHLPAGRVARYVHRGSYDRLAEAYQLLERFMSARRISPAGAPWEVYVVDPADVDFDPERLVTEISWPIGDA